MIVNRNYPIILYFFLQTLMERTLVAIMTILERIQELAQKKDKNLKEISLELGFSKNYLYSLKKQAPSSDKLSKLADYFGVSTDYLLGRTEKQTESRQQTINEAIDTAMANDGKELDQHDKDVIKSLIEAYLDNKK